MRILTVLAEPVRSMVIQDVNLLLKLTIVDKEIKIFYRSELYIYVKTKVKIGTYNIKNCLGMERQKFNNPRTPPPHPKMSTRVRSGTELGSHQQESTDVIAQQ